VPGADEELASSAVTARRHHGSGPGAADLTAIAVGGGVGSLLRDLLSAAFPAGAGFPWAIFAVNVSGCFCLGVLLVYLLDVWPPRRLLRPFLAVGLIGGYTTFSTYAGGVVILLTGGATALAAAYALTSVLAALVAVWAGMKGARTASALPGRRRAAHADGPARAGPAPSGPAPGDRGDGG
jgi:CrcB protein